ncbi:MAG: DMT family transporter [Gammaproteobacteria bacterium]|jgi:drug/metabolite transporter (DMT)-like permease|nr:DMT family transporter [Gammaproteobacteria bacterium]
MTVRVAMLVVSAAGSLSAMHAIVRFLSPSIHPFELAFFRSLFGFIVILPLLLRGGIDSVRTHQPRLQMLRGVVSIAAMMSWFYGLSMVPLAEATALSFTNVIFGSLAAIIFLREKMTMARGIAVFIGFVGVLVILRPGFVQMDIGVVCVLFSALCWGCSVVIVKQLGRTDAAVSIVAWVGIQLSILSLPFALSVWVWPTMEEWLWLSLLGTLATIGHLCMVQGLKLTDAMTIFPLDFTRLIWASLFGLFIFSEWPDVWTFVGAGIIVISGTFMLYREDRI